MSAGKPFAYRDRLDSPRARCSKWMWSREETLIISLYLYQLRGWTEVAKIELEMAICEGGSKKARR